MADNDSSGASNEAALMFNTALREHRSGNSKRARYLYQQILENYANHTDTLHYLGVLYLQDKNFPSAIQLIKKSLAIDSQQADALSNLGYCFNALKRHHEAIEICKSAVALQPTHDNGWTNLGVAQKGLGLFLEAKYSYEQALALQPNNPIYLYNLGCVYLELERFEQARGLFEKCLGYDEAFSEAHNNLSSCLFKLGQFKDALTHASRALDIKSNFPDAWGNRGSALSALGEHNDALFCHEQAVSLQPTSASSWFNRAVVLSGLQRSSEALTSYEQALALSPNYCSAWFNRGVLLNGLRQYKEALASYDRALEIQPENAETWFNRGVALNNLLRHEEAIASYERALELDSRLNFTLGSLIHSKMLICDWANLGVWLESLENGLEHQQLVSQPFPVLGLVDSPKLHRLAAEIYAGSISDTESDLQSFNLRPKAQKIRIGYFSMDFRDHAVSHLIAELIDHHDRNVFEIYGFSFGIDTQDSMRIRLENSFDRFFDVREKNDSQITHLAHELYLDIAVDLGGHTKNARPRIFTARVAPIQISYLGFLGTWGSRCMDYIIGDRIVLNSENRGEIIEKSIILPNQFQINPSGRPLSPSVPSRSSFGLPEKSFVFCCFNNSWKITPSVFYKWMRILKRTPNSVLWLYADNLSAKNNLRESARKCGLQPDRIIFAERAPRDKYLERYTCADLFLDTLPYNAGTTASDALWATLPVITQAGKSFVSRMAASLLLSIGLPELVTESSEEYETLAIDLASNAEKLSEIRARLIENRSTAPLFDARLLTKHIEAGYQMAYERYHSSLPPEHLYVSK